MARNIEIKARVRDPGALRQRVTTVADRGPETLEQEDTFFRCAEGRLKLRQTPGGSGELIFYRRPDAAGPIESDYLVAAIELSGDLRQLLTRALGIRGSVRKCRDLFHAGRTRIHLDAVEGLGNFLELEVVLERKEPAAAGVQEAERLMEALGIRSDDLVPQAYIDLLDPDGSDR